jgi:hypothetical protein
MDFEKPHTFPQDSQKDILSSKISRLQYLNKGIRRAKVDFASEARQAESMINDIILEVINNSIFKDYTADWVIEFESCSEVREWHPYITSISVSVPKGNAIGDFDIFNLKNLIKQIEEATSLKVITYWFI